MLPYYEVCRACGFEETEEEQFIGIFPAGQTMRNTNGNLCGLYACPKCNTVRHIEDRLYLEEKKKIYKEQIKR